MIDSHCLWSTWKKIRAQKNATNRLFGFFCDCNIKVNWWIWRFDWAFMDQWCIQKKMIYKTIDIKGRLIGLHPSYEKKLLFSSLLICKFRTGFTALHKCFFSFRCLFDFIAQYNPSWTATNANFIWLRISTVQKKTLYAIHSYTYKVHHCFRIVTFLYLN